MKCKQCETEFEGKFCPNCGSRVETSSEIASTSAETQQNSPLSSNGAKTTKPFYKKWWFILIAIIAVIIIIAKVSGGENSEKIEWSSLELGEYLPEAENAYGEIGVNLTNALSITIHDVTNEYFKNYKTECINKGYTIESEETTTTYSAFNNEGYEVRLVKSTEKLYIHLDAPEEMSEFEWPSKGIGAMLPATKSNLGDISWDNSKTFIVHVGNTTIDDYKDYVEACEDKGFTVDYSKDDEYYSAENADGYKLTLRYLGFNSIEVSLKAPEEDTTTNNSGSEKETTTNDSKSEEDTKKSEDTSSSSSDDSSSEMSKEFKEAMDSYEEFMDEYVSFMKKYSKSDGTDISLISDYAKYMSKYADVCEDFEKWEDEEMNAAETAYYIKVQTRVNKKLLEVAN